MAKYHEKVGYLEMSQDVYDKFRESFYPKVRSQPKELAKAVPYDVASWVDHDGSWEIVIVDGVKVGPNKVLFTKKAA